MHPELFYPRVLHAGLHGGRDTRTGHVNEGAASGGRRFVRERARPGLTPHRRAVAGRGGVPCRSSRPASGGRRARTRTRSSRPAASSSGTWTTTRPVSVRAAARRSRPGGTRGRGVARVGLGREALGGRKRSALDGDAGGMGVGPVPRGGVAERDGESDVGSNVGCPPRCPPRPPGLLSAGARNTTRSYSVLVSSSTDGADKIVTGSLSGMLRVFLPHQAGYRVDDLMLEQSLDAPILQLGLGRFQPCVVACAGRLGSCSRSFQTRSGVGRRPTLPIPSPSPARSLARSLAGRPR